jgi:NAD(P)-dependent dehydrogenase (short-subunit alcohol dehydrogenase family)
MQSLYSLYTQCFPPSPTFVDSYVGPQLRRVFLITGGNSGLGLELVKRLYPTGATIYLACRSQERAEAAIQEVIDVAKKADISTPGKLKFLHLDLADLSSIRKSAAAFTEQESRLDILWNNAGIGGCPVGTTTAQGIEGHVGVNCVGALMLTQALLPLLRAAVRDSPPGSVRVVWTASLSIEAFAPVGGARLDQLNCGSTQYPVGDYAQSKVGNWWLAIEMARRYAIYGIVSVAQNPGQLDTDVWKHQAWWLMILVRPTLYKRSFGAYTMLYAGFSKDLVVGDMRYVMPWGRLRIWNECPRRDIVEAMERGGPKWFWEWCEESFRPYM